MIAHLRGYGVYQADGQWRNRMAVDVLSTLQPSPRALGSCEASTGWHDRLPLQNAVLLGNIGIVQSPSRLPTALCWLYNNGVACR